MGHIFPGRPGYGQCLVWLVAAFALAGAPEVRADPLRFRAELEASSEVPPNQTTGHGTFTANYDTATRTLSWNGSYSGLTGPVTAAHIHGPAAVGVNARAIVWLSDNLGQCKNGECRSKPDAKASNASPFSGSAILTDAQAAEMMNGLYYINIHTNAHPAGELRGQLVKTP